MDHGPIAILKDYERRALSCAVPVPEVHQSPPQWLGVELGGERVLLSLADVQEVLKPPTLTRVPGAQAWLRGVAHVRGRLLTVIDLKGLLGGAISDLGPESRVVVLREMRTPFGVSVDRVWGLQGPKQTPPPERSEETADWLKPHVSGTQYYEGSAWAVLELNAVLAGPRLLHGVVQSNN